jgi:uncharacterized protein YjbI with pentapeptide repeats
VSWTAPTSDGGSPITGYTVTASHGGATCSTTGDLHCNVTGLTNAHLYKVHVKASNLRGLGKPSAKVPVTPEVSPDCTIIGPYADLHGCNFTSANLNDMNLTGVNLTAANLTSADLILTNLTSADLDDVAASFANLGGANLTDASFVEATLIYASIRGDTLNSTNFNDADLAAANLNEIYPTNADFTNANLGDASVDSSADDGIIWSNTTCPDETNSDDDGGTCVNHFTPS